MSLNKFSNVLTGFDLKLDGGFDEVKCNSLDTTNVNTSTINGEPIPSTTPINYGLATGLETQTITSTGLETKLYPNNLSGSITIPANTMKAGDTYHAHFTGLFKDDTLGGNTLTFLIRAKDNTVLLDDFTIALPGSYGTRTYTLDIYYVVREIGPASTAVMATSAVFTITGAVGTTLATPVSVMSNASNPSTFSTEEDNTLGVFVQFSTATADLEMRGFITNLTKIK